MKRGASRSGFTLLEVMLAVAIMAISLAAVFSAEAGSVKMAHRARKLSFATLLARCKMGELEEDLMKKGLPAAEQTDTDECCKDAPIDGFKCRSEVVPIVLPDSMFGGDEDEDGKGKKGGAKPGATGSGSAPSSSSSSSDSKGKGGLTGLLGAAAAALGGGKEGEAGKSKDGQDAQDAKDGKDKDGKDKKPDKENPQDLLSGDPSRLLSGGGGEVDGISAMAMQYVYPILKPSFQSQIRRVTVTVEWSEGSADKTFDLTQYFVAEQPVPLATDPNDPNATGTGTGTGTTPGTSSTTGSGTSAFGFTQ